MHLIAGRTERAKTLRRPPIDDRGKYDFLPRRRRSMRRHEVAAHAALVAWSMSSNMACRSSSPTGCS